MKNSEILYSLGTEILQFEQIEAELFLKFTFCNFWNCLVVSFPMYTGTFWKSQKMLEEKIRPEVAYPTLENSLGTDNDSRPQPSLNPTILIYLFLLKLEYLIDD